MFTGIVEEVGVVRRAEPHRLVIGARKVLAGLEEGGSIAVNGVCLTAVAVTRAAFTVELSAETLARTNLGALAPGHQVDLEPPVAMGAPMGGHVVQGHVDGVCTVVELAGPPHARVLTIRVPRRLARYIMEKGFVALDGISLTVASRAGLRFSVSVVPYTYDHTVLAFRRPGDAVNIEVDILAKYVERLVRGRS